MIISSKRISRSTHRNKNFKFSSQNFVKNSHQKIFRSVGFENLKKFYLVAKEYCEKHSGHHSRDVRTELLKLKADLRENSNYELNKALTLRRTMLLDTENTFDETTTEKSLEKQENQRKLVIQSMISGAFRDSNNRRISNKIKVIDYRDNDKISNIVEK